MIKADITSDEKWLVLSGMTDYEREQVLLWFTKEMPNAFIMKQRIKGINTDVHFMNRCNVLPLGLWNELINCAKRFSYQIEFTPEALKCLYDKNANKKEIMSYFEELFLNAHDDKGNVIIPKDYQKESVYRLIKFRHCCLEITTSGGKTLISYMMFRYLYDIKGIRNFLYIIPSKDLVDQSMDDFEQYEGWVGGSHEWTSCTLTSKSRKKDKIASETVNILFSTFQLLARRSKDFLSRFEVIFVDECHHMPANSMKRIIMNSADAGYVFGVTGTFPKFGGYNNFIVQSYIGPLVFQLSAYDLINTKKFACPVIVVENIMRWADDKQKQILYESRQMKMKNDFQMGSKLFKAEADFIDSSAVRMKYICRLVSEMKQNAMILFGDVHRGEYGKKIYDYLKDTTEKNIYYADGDTPVANRKYYNECLENDTTGNTIIVASIKTYGEGIDLHNLYSIFLVNSLKSEKQLRQILGRGMRNYTNPETGKKKKYVLLFDFIDDLRTDNYREREAPSVKFNYAWRQFMEREKIYQEQKFPIYRRISDFSPK